MPLPSIGQTWFRSLQAKKPPATQSQEAASAAYQEESDRERDQIEVCPGEGPRYGDFRCHHDNTHRVCAQLLDADGSPLQWGPKGDFWLITGQKEWQWDHQIRSAPNPGDSWCICMWAFARVVNTVGCDKVPIRCESTDVDFLL